ncbi:hypothetical protein J1614_005643 [Plenodomus biglobosus]|nr:hypothetical protein J1614_005643 [Plenodomus biglobosus]
MYRTKLMLQDVDGANVSVEKKGFAGGLHGGFNDGYAVDHSRRNIKYGVRCGEVTGHSVEITPVGMVAGFLAIDESTDPSAADFHVTQGWVIRTMI